LVGDLSTSGINGKVSIVLAISTTDQGKPQMSVTSATLGNFPLPASMLTTISTAVNEGLQNQAGLEFEVESISISDHKLIITAQKK
ncbi:MAG TPA: hypothetical protein VF338_06760, partial [Leptolinea sp.]